jgi:hypothetical protein
MRSPAVDAAVFADRFKGASNNDSLAMSPKMRALIPERQWGIRTGENGGKRLQTQRDP